MIKGASIMAVGDKIRRRGAETPRYDRTPWYRTRAWTLDVALSSAGPDNVGQFQFVARIR